MRRVHPTVATEGTVAARSAPDPEPADFSLTDVQPEAFLERSGSMTIIAAAAAKAVLVSTLGREALELLPAMGTNELSAA
jgi:hypothetical protein